MNIKELLSNKKFQPLTDVAIFAVLILGFHFFFRWWAYDLHYWPIIKWVMPTYEFLTDLLYRNSVWALEHLTNYEFTINEEQREIYIGAGSVKVNYGCSGLKQFLQWIVLMTFYPGPWKQKLWFIPAGLIIVHLVNIFRITGLSVLLEYYPQHWQFSHDYFFRPFFYVVMFGMWVIWVEKFKNRRVSRKHNRRKGEKVIV